MPSTSDETAGVPEAPGAWPLVGHAPRLLRDRLAFLQDTRLHGDLVAIRIGPRRAYVVNGLELVRDVLTRRSSQFQLSPQFRLMQRIIGNGLLVTDGAFHRRQRRLVLPAFHREHVRGYASVMASLAQNRFDGWREGVLPALDEEFGSLAAEVVARCLFSSDCDQRTADRIAEDLPHLMTWVGSRGFDPSGLLAKLPTPDPGRAWRGRGPGCPCAPGTYTWPRPPQRSLGRPRPVSAPTGSRSGVPLGHQSSWPGSDS
ncbi:cytochrome P450 [Streptomyces violaceus]